MDLFDGAFGGLDELALGIAPLVAAQQPVRDHVEVAPDRTDRPDRFAQLGKFILRKWYGVVELLPDQGNDPALGGLPGCFRQLTHTLNFMVPQPKPKLAAVTAATG
ncbi:MAG: hypothetical protein EPN38_08030 [Rhodanobacteraceae bacterium]|nr:MAG: hypothetical protein EPN38_08030 [Rhodanobacteraceae bacterium]